MHTSSFDKNFSNDNYIFEDVDTHYDTLSICKLGKWYRIGEKYGKNITFPNFGEILEENEKELDYYDKKEKKVIIIGKFIFNDNGISEEKCDIEEKENGTALFNCDGYKTIEL